MSQAWRAGAGSLGLAVASLAGASSARADAFDNAYVSGGTYVTYAFGATQPWGWGLEARAGGDTWDYQCFEDTSELAFAGGALRFEWFPSSHTRLIIAAQAGHTFASIAAGRGELGVGYRWGREGGIEGLFGAELDVSVAALALHFEPVRTELSPALGVFFPTPTVHESMGCVIPGRPQRTDVGSYAGLPELALYAPRRSRTARAKDFHARDWATDRAPAELAGIWARRAQHEWASIPAFSAVAEQLHAAAAPRALIARCHMAMRDELRHALLAGGRCAQLSGQQVALTQSSDAPRPVLFGGAALTRLAIESWVDGVLGEGTAASHARAEAQVAEDAELRESQARVARDEQRHAELAWDVLEWALYAGGAEVHAALHAARLATPSAYEEGSGENLARFGILTHEQRTELAERQRAHAVRRLDGLLAQA